MRTTRSWRAAASALSFAAALAICRPAEAQQYALKHYTQEQGLANLSLNALAQDPQGFLWVGTQNGLFRYEGTSFRLYGVADGLPTQDVLALHVDRRGTLWAGGLWGVAWFNGRYFRNVENMGAATLTGVDRFASDQKHVYAASANGLLRTETLAGGYAAVWVARGAMSGIDIDKSGTVWVGCDHDVR